jgi:hypothetical protein
MLLRSALRASAAFSTLSGLALLAAPGAIGAVLGVQAPEVHQGIGLALLVFAADLLWFSRTPHTLRAIGRAAVAGDAAWMLGTLALALASPGLLRRTGWVLAGAVALAVAGFGAAQALGLRRLPPHGLTHG